MNRKFLSTKLEVELIIVLILSFIISVCIFFLLQTTGESLLDKYFDKTSFLENQKKQTISEFKTYVSDNNLTINDHDRIENWIRKYKYIDIYIYEDNNLIYNSDRDNISTNYKKYEASPVISNNTLYDISFADINAKMYIECFFEYKYYYIVDFIGVVISLLCFIILMIFFINRKISYIGQLENEIQILEGGDLTYEITIDGNDEISSLAQRINEMRKSFIERLESEDKARLANRELITAMSHDLRTPLTALVGYLDIIEYKKYKTEESFNQYIHNSREKAYQIKHLSDKLFEYFIVFNTNDDMKLETFNGNALLEQIMEEQIFMLEEKGFIINANFCYEPFQLDVNLISIQRVFDNIFSNIYKYANRFKVIEIKYHIKNEKLLISIENQVNNLKLAESTGIGLKTCRKIIEMHKGKFHTVKTDNKFLAQITLMIKLD